MKTVERVVWFAIGVCVGVLPVVARPADPATSPALFASAMFPVAVVVNRPGSDGGDLSAVACVETMARFHGINQLKGLTAWSAVRPGGCDPKTLDGSIRDFCAFRHVRPPEYLSSETLGPADVENFHRAGRLVMVGDRGGEGSRYKRDVRTASIVCYIDGHHVCVHDPNYVEQGERFEWMSRKEFDWRFLGWVVVLNQAGDSTGR